MLADKEKTTDRSESLGDPEAPKGPYMCPKCHRPIDPYDSNSRRDAKTRKWEHVDCRTKPRRGIAPI